MSQVPNEAVEALLQAMPTWLSKKNPLQPPHYVYVSYDAERELFVVTPSDGTPAKTFVDFPKATKEALAMDASKYEVLFSRSLLDHSLIKPFIDDEVGASRGLVAVLWEGKRAHSFHHSRTWANAGYTKADSLTEAHRREKDFLADPTNPVLAHEFVRGNPATWQYYGDDKNSLDGDWETETIEAYTIDMWEQGNVQGGSQIIVQLEGHIRNEDADDDTVRFAFDSNLVGEAESFEKAIVQLAEKFYLHYGCCGEARKHPLTSLKPPAAPCKWIQLIESNEEYKIG